MDCLFGAVSPGINVDALRRELGGAVGTTTSTVHGKVRFGFSQAKEPSAPEFITAQPEVGSSMAPPSVSASNPQPTPGNDQRSHGKDSYFCFNGVRCPWDKVCCPGGRETCVSETGKCEKATPNFQTRIGYQCNRFTNEPCTATQKCVLNQLDVNDPLTVTSACQAM